MSRIDTEKEREEIRLLKTGSWDFTTIRQLISLASHYLDIIDAKEAEIQILEDKLQTAQTDAEFFQSEVKLRNRIPGSSQELADLLREVEKEKQDIVAKDAEIERLREQLLVIARADEVDMLLDPTWASRIAHTALRSTDS